MDSGVKDGYLVTGAGAHGIASSRDGKTAVISNQTAVKVSVIDVVNRKILTTLNVGNKPNGLVIR